MQLADNMVLGWKAARILVRNNLDVLGSRLAVKKMRAPNIEDFIGLLNDPNYIKPEPVAVPGAAVGVSVKSEPEETKSAEPTQKTDAMEVETTVKVRFFNLQRITGFLTIISNRLNKNSHSQCLRRKKVIHHLKSLQIR